jgi:hypothetical protein
MAQPPFCVSGRLGVINQAEDLHSRGRQQYFTECVNPGRCVLGRTDATLPELIQLIETA